MDKVKGILSEGDYAELSKDLSAECDRLERSAAEGRKKVEELEAQAETDGGCRERAGRYMKSGRLSREIVEAMIDHIYVGKRIPGTKNVRGDPLGFLNFIPRRGLRSPDAAKALKLFLPHRSRAESPHHL